jgi:hypothetical protein
VNKESLSDRLKKAGLKKAASSEKDASIELLSSFYLSTTEHQNRENQHKVQTERISQRAVKILGEAIGKKGSL